MAKVASYLSRKIGRSIHLFDVSGAKLTQQSWDGGEIFDAGGKLTAQRIQPENQDPALGLAVPNNGTRTLRLNPRS